MLGVVRTTVHGRLNPTRRSDPTARGTRRHRLYLTS
jgi:hypothetical protein